MKLRMANTLRNRAASTDKDARVLNGFVERRPDAKDPRKPPLTYVVKRPAADSAFSLNSGSGQALYVTTVPDNQEPVVGVVINDILTREPTALTKSLSFGVQPSNVALNTAISPSVTVRIVNSFGSLVNSSANVTVALSSNPTGATLGGTLTQAASAGTATFNNLTLNRSGEDFTLRATSSGLNSATSDTFDIATHLTFTIQPAGAQPGATLAAIEVTVQDSANATDTAYNGTITIAIYSGPGELSGTTEVAAVSGVATFSNLRISSEGDYRLVATAEEISNAYPPTLSVSNLFAIGSYSLTIESDTSDYNVATAFSNKYGTPPASITLNVTINSGVIVSASATSTRALTWGAGWTGTNTFNLTNNGYLIGKGGAAGNAGENVTITTPAGSGSAGGNAVELSGLTVSITNASGFIWGGGGGGGGGGYTESGAGLGTGAAGGGGGGGGAGSGAGTNGGGNLATDQWTSTTLSTNGGTPAGSLATQTGGSAGTGGRCDNAITGPTFAIGGNGGAGGDYGTAGSAGTNGSSNDGGATINPSGSGGAAGKAINLSGGTANFVSGSGNPNVKGAVS